MEAGLLVGLIKQKTKMAYTSSQNAGGLDTLDNSTLADSDLNIVGDVSDSNRAKAITFTNIKAFLKTYFDAVSSVLTNKTLISTTNVIEEISAITDSATPTPTGGSLRNAFDVTALGQAATFAAPSGTPANWNKLIVRIKDNGTARGLSWNAIYVAGGVALPTTTVLSKILVLLFMYNTANSLNKWQLIASSQEA